MNNLQVLSREEMNQVVGGSWLGRKIYEFTVDTTIKVIKWYYGIDDGDSNGKTTSVSGSGFSGGGYGGGVR